MTGFILASQAIQSDGSGWAQWLINVGVAVAMLVYLAKYFIPKLLEGHREEREQARREHMTQEDKLTENFLSRLDQLQVAAEKRDDKFMELFEREREARDKNFREQTSANVQQATAMIKLSESMDSLRADITSTVRRRRFNVVEDDDAGTAADC
jgi:hypothetical protein